MQKTSFPDWMNDLRPVEALLQAAIGTQTRMSGCQIVKTTPDYAVLLVKLRHPYANVIIKLAGPSARMASDFDRTASIHHLVQKSTTIPMPEIIAVDVSCQIWPWRYLIRTYVPGREWAGLSQQMHGIDAINAYRQLGEAIGQLHGIAFPAFGEIDACGQVTKPDASCLAAIKRRAGILIHSPRLRDLFFVALEQRSALFEKVEESRLCHEDLHGYNILFNQQAGAWRLATILDFDKAWAGHVETDLARMEIWRGMTSPDFWTAYRVYYHPDEDYHHRRPVYQLLWCLEYARPTREHLADTQDVCRELGLPVLESLDDVE